MDDWIFSPYTCLKFRFAIEYDIHKQMTIRAGVQMKPNRIGFGFTMPINNKALFSYGFLTHPILPLSHNIEVGLLF